MEDELVTKPLLVKQEPDNISNSNGHGESSGAGAAVRQNDSSATFILIISTFVVACSTFTGGCVGVYSSLAESGIIVDLGLTVAEEKIGKEREFEATLQRLRGQNADTSHEASEIKVGVGLMVLQGLGGPYVFTFYMSEIFDSAGISSTVGFLVVAILQIPATVLGASLIDKFGRRTLLMASAFGECLGCFLTGLSFLLQDHNWWKEVSPILALIGVLVYLGSYSFGMGGIPWIIVSEIFPINVKGSAGTLCNLVSWFCSWIVSYTFNFLFEWSSAGDPSSFLTSSMFPRVLMPSGD
nr:sugar transporter erd6-like 5 [Quercus suber]